MIFTRRTPCKHCPFRLDVPGFLRRARAIQIVHSLRDEDGKTFPCHESLPRTDSSTKKVVACAGSLIVTERDQGPNQMHRIAYRLGIYDPSKLDREAPCFNNFDEFIKHHADATRPTGKR